MRKENPEDGSTADEVVQAGLGTDKVFPHSQVPTQIGVTGTPATLTDSPVESIDDVLPNEVDPQKAGLNPGQGVDVSREDESDPLTR